MAQFDKGMNIDIVNTVAADMGNQAERARTEIMNLMGELRSLGSSWLGNRATDMANKINAAESNIQQFHVEMKTMNDILLQNAQVFQAFDTTP